MEEEEEEEEEEDVLIHHSGQSREAPRMYSLTSTIHIHSQVAAPQAQRWLVDRNDRRAQRRHIPTI